jgi:hypothetical protein
MKYVPTYEAGVGTRFTNVVATLVASPREGISMKRTIGLWSAVLLALAAASCNDPTSRSCVCTLNYVTIHLVVVNDQRDLETGVTVVSTIARTGKTVEPRGVVEFIPGSYAIITDFEKNLIEPRLGDDVIVTGTKDTRSFQATVHVSVDDCLCHIHEEAGPDTVVIR